MALPKKANLIEERRKKHYIRGRAIREPGAGILDVPAIGLLDVPVMGLLDLPAIGLLNLAVPAVGLLEVSAIELLDFPGTVLLDVLGTTLLFFCGSVIVILGVLPEGLVISLAIFHVWSKVTHYQYFIFTWPSRAVG